MNTTVNFEIAKLLKEKGFEERAKSYNQEGKLVTVSIIIRRFNPDKIYYPAPTIAEVVIWLYEKHGIWINVNITRYGKFWCNVIFKEECKDLNTPFTWEFVNQLNDFNSPTEAYEAAINYCLINLI